MIESIRHALRVFSDEVVATWRECDDPLALERGGSADKDSWHARLGGTKIVSEAVTGPDFDVVDDCETACLEPSPGSNNGTSLESKDNSAQQRLRESLIAMMLKSISPSAISGADTNFDCHSESEWGHRPIRLSSSGRLSLHSSISINGALTR
jgi:hypothetical protein